MRLYFYFAGWFIKKQVAFVVLTSILTHRIKGQLGNL